MCCVEVCLTISIYRQGTKTMRHFFILQLLLLLSLFAISAETLQRAVIFHIVHWQLQFKVPIIRQTC